MKTSIAVRKRIEMYEGGIEKIKTIIEEKGDISSSLLLEEMEHILKAFKTTKKVSERNAKRKIEERRKRLSE